MGRVDLSVPELIPTPSPLWHLSIFTRVVTVLQRQQAAGRFTLQSEAYRLQAPSARRGDIGLAVQVSISEEENSELLQGLRGAGTSFGVVTGVTFKLYALCCWISAPAQVPGFAAATVATDGDRSAGECRHDTCNIAWHGGWIACWQPHQRCVSRTWLGLQH